MSKVVIDTNVLIDFLAGRRDCSELFFKASGVLVPLVVIGEFLAGLSDTRADAARRNALELFLAMSSVEKITFTEETAQWYASIHRQLRQAGTPIPQNDVWIAAQTLEHGAVLCTRDGDFRAVANLRIVEDTITP